MTHHEAVHAVEAQRRANMAQLDMMLDDLLGCRARALTRNEMDDKYPNLPRLVEALFVHYRPPAAPAGGLLDAAALVVDRWSSGDLAEAVRLLAAHVEAAKTAEEPPAPPPARASVMDHALATALAGALQSAEFRGEPEDRRSQISAEPAAGGGYEFVIRKRSGRVVAISLDGAIEWRSQAEYDHQSPHYGNSVSFAAEGHGE